MRVPAAPRSEHDLVDQVIRRLREVGWAHKVHGSQYGQAGEPDVDACIHGRSTKVEVKMPGKKPTPVQYAALRRWERAGALVGWVDSLAALEELLTHLDEPGWTNPSIAREGA